MGKPAAKAGTTRSKSSRETVARAGTEGSKMPQVARNRNLECKSRFRVARKSVRQASEMRRAKRVIVLTLRRSKVPILKKNKS